MRIPNIGSLEHTGARHACQFESAAGAGDAAGESIIRESTFTHEERSLKELGTKRHANKEELEKSLPSLTNYLVNYKPL